VSSHPTGEAISISWVRGHRRSREMAQALGVTPHFIYAPGGSLPIRYFKQWRATKRLLKEQSPSAVMVMQPPPVALWAARGYARKHGIPLLGDLHSGVFMDPKWQWAAGSVLRTLRKRGAAIVPNVELAERTRAAGVPTFVVPAYIQPIERAATPASPPRILVPLTYSRDEPVTELLEAARQTPEFRWQFTGRAPQHVRDAAPENVEFVGFVSDEEYLALIQHASAIAAITTQEGTMQSAGYEALASATPLLTTPTRVLVEYFGDAARYAAPEAAALADGARDLVANGAQWSAGMVALREGVLVEQQRAAEQARAWLRARIANDPAGQLVGQRVLFVASTGGHLAQLVRLSRRAQVHPDSRWVSFESPQSLSLLADKHAVMLPYIASRDLRGTLRAVKQLDAELTGRQFDVVISTGAAVAMTGFLWARKHKVRRVYVESFSRVQGPSLTGRLVAASRIAKRYTQHPLWNRRGWQPFQGVLAGFAAADRPAPASDRSLKVLVTLGTIRPYQFTSLVEAVRATGVVGPDSTWQLGVTKASDLPGRSVELLPADEFDRLALEADVVVTHSGVGTVLQLLELGVYPVIVPRRKARGEHVDDHQEQIGRYIAEAGLGTFVEVGDLTAEVLRDAAARRIVSAD